MGAVLFRFRVELRTRWRALLGLALLLGLAGGLALAAVAGARRTESANTRLLRDVNARDVAVLPDVEPSSLDFAAVERLPQVAQTGVATWLPIVPRVVSSPVDAEEGFGIVLASDGRFAETIDRPKVLEGRLPDPRRAQEVLVNPVLAKLRHIGVGDRIRVVALSLDEVATVENSRDFPALAAALRRGELGTPISLRIVGVGIAPEEVVVDDQFAAPRMFLTPAFLRLHPQIEPFGEALSVRLRGGAAAIPGFRRDVEQLANGEAISFQTATATRAKVDRAVRPQVLVLSVFAIVVVLTGALVAGQAIARYTFVEAADSGTLSAIGATRSQLFAITMLRVAVTAIAGAAVAVALAIALSPLTPIGPARTAEPFPGFAVDGFVLVLGVLAIVLVAAALAAIPAWRAARAGNAAHDEASRPSALIGACARASFPPPVVAGVRLATEPGKGRTAVPVRTTIVGGALAIAMVVAAVVFATSLDHLVSTPRLYGWNWDALVNASGDDPAGTRAQARALEHVLETSSSVRTWEPATLSSMRLQSGSVSALGIEPDSPIGPTVASGRLPRRGDEIALGARTLRALDAEIGDSVIARANDGSRRHLRVVGQVVLPALGLYPGSDKTALGEGAVVTRSAITTLGPDFNVAQYIVAFRPDADRASREHVLDRIRNEAGSGTSGNTGHIDRPSDIVSYEQVGNVPFVLAAILAALALAMVSHALVMSVRRRRRDLALFATLGFTRRQVSSTVAWQATTVGVFTLLVGVPLGVVLGRLGWSALANDLGAVAEPIVPVVAVIVAVPAVLVLMNLVAFVPGRMAARLRPATVLRSE
jgi:ABC-type lipoprotein release transport system permease subunit